MVNPFQIIGERLAEIGVYDFLFPAIITSAIIYALLRKTKLFGEEAVVVNGVLALVFSFFIWGYAVSLPLMSLDLPLSKFITHFFIISLIFLFAFIGASLAYPDFSEALNRAFGGSNTIIYIFLVIMIIIFFFTSGLGELLNLSGTILKGSSGVLILFLLFIFLGLAAAVTAVIPPKS